MLNILNVLFTQKRIEVYSINIFYYYISSTRISVRKYKILFPYVQFLFIPRIFSHEKYSQLCFIYSYKSHDIISNSIQFVSVSGELL